MKKLSFQTALAGFLIPLAAVIFLVISGADIVIALFSAVLIETVFCLVIRVPWEEINDAMMKGGSGMLGAILIMILVGIMVATWMASGTIPALLYYGTKLITPALFLPVTFILCTLAALATGSSWSSAATMGIALLGIAEGMGMPLPLVVGAIISGAIVGDKMSPLSDSVLLASASTETDIFDLIACLMYTTVPLCIVCLVFFGVSGLKYSGAAINLEGIAALTDGLLASFTINPIMLLPLLIVLVMSLKKCPSFLAFAAGILSSILIAVVFQGEKFMDVLAYAVNGFHIESGVEAVDRLLNRGGALSMGQVVFASMMAGMFSGLLKNLGILEVLMEKLRLVVKTSRSLIISTVCICALLMMGGGGQYTTLTLPGAAFGKFYEDMDIHSSVLGRTLEDIATMLDPIIPWTVSGIYYSGLFNVPVAAYTPFTIIAFLSPVIAIINALFGIGVFRRNDRVRYNPFWRRTPNR